MLGLSSLCFANWAVLQFGPRGCLIIDCASSFILMLGVTAAKFSNNTSIEYAGALGGALVAGTGIAWGWSGQGVYFGRVAEKYAKVQCNSKFPSRLNKTLNFSPAFLCFELIWKVTDMDAVEVSTKFGSASSKTVCRQTVIGSHCRPSMFGLSNPKLLA